MPNLTTVAKWADSLGISRQQGYAAVKRCNIVLTDGQLDAEYATILYHRHTRLRAGAGREPGEAGDPDRGGGGGGGGGGGTELGPDYMRERARREAAEAAIAEMKQAEMEKKYLIKTDVAAVVFQIARSMRDGLTNSARRIAADVAGLSDAGACEEVIDREHRALLISMTRTVSVKLGIEDDAQEESE